MAGTIIADKIQTENAFLTLNVGQTLVATINSSGILNSSGGTMIGANGSVSNTAITGVITGSQLASPLSLTGNVSLTGNLNFNSTGTSGVRLPTANTLAFYTAGTEDMRIDATGNVGIGTSSPTGKLDVSSSSAGVSAGDLVVDTANKTVYVGRQSSTGGDNSYLVVRGRLNANGTSQAIVITGDTTAYGTGLFRPGNDIIGFSTTGSERMRIGSDGALDVGSTTGTVGLGVFSNYGSRIIDFARYADDGAIVGFKGCGIRMCRCFRGSVIG
jgi:hypothetical protein